MTFEDENGLKVGRERLEVEGRRAQPRLESFAKTAVILTIPVTRVSDVLKGGRLYLTTPPLPLQVNTVVTAMVTTAVNMK